MRTSKDHGLDAMFKAAGGKKKWEAVQAEAEEERAAKAVEVVNSRDAVRGVLKPSS